MTWTGSIVLFSAGLSLFVLSVRLLCLVFRRERELEEIKRRLRK